MVNTLEQGDNELVPLDYSDLLEKILQTLKNQNLFRLSAAGDRLLINIDSIASQVAALPVQNPLTSNNGVRSATVNFTRTFRESFPHKIEQIRDCLKSALASTLPPHQSIDEFVTSLATPLASFQGKTTQLSFNHTFDKPSPSLQKQKLSLERNRPGSAALLKFHKLTITVYNINQFQQQLQQGLENYIEQIVESESERGDFQDILEDLVSDELSDFHKLKRVVDTETLGKLKKEAKIRYLEYLRDNSETRDTLGMIYLQDLIRRLRLIEEFISDDSKADSYYEVNYAGATVNYKDMFSRAEVFDALPIIPIVTGNLGETTDSTKGDRQFVFGLKLKFGNPVQAQGGNEVFDYHLNQIDPDSQEHSQELERNPNFGIKVLRLAFLYYFIFASRSNPQAENYNPETELQYDPIGVFEEKVLPVLRGSDQEAKKEIFRKLKTGFATFNVKFKIKTLKKLLQDILGRQAISPTRTYPSQIRVKNGVLERDINSIFQKQTFFHDVVSRNPKECLRYISIGEANVDESALCQLPVSITLEDVRYFATEESQAFRMEYDIEDIAALPMMWVPESCRESYENWFMKKQTKLVLFRYNNRRLDPKELDSIQAFIYRFTVSLIAYICLKLLLDESPNRLCIPMMRLHEGDQNNPAPSEKFIAQLSKALCHLLNEKHRCSSQGFRVRNLERFRITNGLTSLYSILPKKFRFSNVSDTPNLDKLAIIIVSSLESDARTGNRNRQNRISNLLGEVISITRQEDSAIRVELLKTFSDNYRNQRLYRNPSILIDTVNHLYQAGYRHLLYIAQAPYTSNLNITQSEENERLYFMSPELIKELKGTQADINIYPAFFDKYYVRKSKNLISSSFYIQDTNQLFNLAQDTSQKAVVFFNLFNGLTVGKGDDRFYNGVISYSTLLNIYPGVLDDQDIRMGLLNDESQLKNDLLQYLTLFHFSRFEKDSNISLKLDPYSNIIGDESFAKLSVFYHQRGEIDFNSLAFLSEVKKVLNK